VVAGSAVNQDGASNGLTAPNGPSQQRVIRAALASAGLSAADVDAVEAHGSGTVLGDPIEAQALIAAYGPGRDPERPLWLGSVKSNIGHAQAAAGAAGVIKMVLALRHGMLPRTLHAEVPSPHVDWSSGAVRLLTEAVPWPIAEGRARRTGVSAFGMSGTNVHLILAESPADAAGAEPEAEEPAPLVDGVVTWPVSGRSAAGLAAQAERLAAWLAARPGLDPADVGWSLATTRSVFEHRAVITGADRAELTAGLAAVAAGVAGTANVVTGVAGRRGKVVFVFPGQGAQWPGMGRELARCCPVFAARLAECGRALAPWVDWDLDQVLTGAPGAPGLERAEIIQPVLWAVMVSLAAVWQAAGVVPDAVVGHSQGEIAAATVAGILTLEDAARVVAVRSRALSELGTSGGMVSVVMPAAEVEELLPRWGDRLAVAAVNSPAATVVSGDAEALAEFEAELAARHVLRWRIPATDFVAHSPRVAELATVVAQDLARVVPVAGRVRLFSTVHCEWAQGPELYAGYWFANMRQRVRFDEAIRALAQAGYGAFIEVSPHPVLTMAMAETLEEASAVPPLISGTLDREDAGARRLLSVLAGVHVAGVTADWRAILGGGQPVELPTSAFQRQRYWPSPVDMAALIAAGGDGAGMVAEARFWAAVEGGDVAGLAGALALDQRTPLGEVVPVLAAWRRREREQSATAGLRYRVIWAPVPDPEPAALSGKWLMVVPARLAGDELVHGCVRALTAAGARVVTVEADLEWPDRAVLADLITRAMPDARELAGVVSLLSVDEEPVAGLPVAAGVAGTLVLVQALGDADVRAPLWALTRGAVATSADELVTSPVQAGMWGLGRVAGLEHPDRWGGLVDLPPVWDELAERRLCGVLAGSGEDQLAVRAGGVFARRLMRAPLPGGGAGWVPRGSVLITGGTGAIGAHVARWAAGRGAARAVLASRSGPDAEGVAALAAELAGTGTAVAVVACDVAWRAHAAGIVSWIGASGPRLSAVIHTAGKGQATALNDTSVTEFAEVWAAKAAGVAHLDELTAELDLEAFVLFSSISATWGAGLQPAYAAANMFLDAIAERRHGRGLAAMSVAFGPWGGGGMRGEDGEQLARRGLRLLYPDLVINALGQAIDAGEHLVTVADVDWAKFAPAFTVRRPSPLISDLPEVTRALAVAEAAAEAAADTGRALTQQLAGLAEAEQVRVLTGVVRSEAAAVLGHPSADAVEEGRAFSEMGFDSLTAVELRNRLNAVSGLRLPATLLFDYPTPVAAAQFVRSQLAGAPAAPSAAPVVTGVTASEPIAIVGMGCRYPGGATDPDALWALLADGADAVTEFPADRGWDLAALFDPDPDRPGTTYVRAAGFMTGAAEFDPGFFGISPREALAMDPQQRLLLETCWEALERAGIDPGSLRGSRTGVFTGASPSGYGAGLEAELAGHLMTGTAISVISGRVSYVLGLEGPAVSVDTACSSSLVAVHLACQALRAGECDLALAGGTAVLSQPGIFAGFSQLQGLAADGRCKSFGASADGMGVGEGAGSVVLERLSDARRNGHRVLAVVRGSAVNQDGASNGLTAPNGPSQQRVIRAALASAGVSPADVDVVEAHGTGTVLGDPIEAQAVIATYGQDRDTGRPLWLGSVKSNLGHTQEAAGVAGLIKMVLALRHDLLPATLHADEPSPHVDWSAGTVKLLTEAVPWPADGERPRRAGVSAFGMSGTNVHLILEEAAAAEPAAGVAGSGVLGSGVAAWLVSGRSAEALRAQAARLAEHVAARPDLDPADVGWSLVTTRSRFEHRAVVTGAGATELAAGLAAVAAGEPRPGVITGVASSGGRGRVGFLFSGQGAQRAGMAAELHAASPVFAEVFDRVCGLLEAELRVPVGEVVLGRDPEAQANQTPRPEAQANQTLYAQTGLFALQAGLIAVLAACGITPDAVAGHSVGEIAAAYAAGVLSLEDACTLVAARARLMQALPEGGAMCAIAASEAEVAAVTAGLGEQAVIAAVNGPAAVVVSGAAAAVEQVAGSFAGRGIRTRSLRVSHAFHSPRMDPVLTGLGRVAGRLRFTPPRVPWACALTGELLDECDAGYWVRQAREPVRFADAVGTLAEQEISVFVEIGPDGTLSALGPAIPDAAQAVFIPAQRPDQAGPDGVLAALARIHAAGPAVDWAAVLGRGRQVELPTYAFARERYWAMPAAAGDASSAGLVPVRHPLLTVAVELASGDGYLLTGQVSAQTLPWLAEHVVAGETLVPAAAAVELAVRAGDAAGCGRIDELELDAPLVLDADGAVQIQVRVGTAAEDGRRAVEIYARAGEANWTRHARGLLAPAAPPAPGLAEELAEWPPAGALPVPAEDLYAGLAAAGYEYGPAFRGLRAAWRRGPDVFAEVALPEQLAPPEEAGLAAPAADGFGLHPALLEAVLHASWLTGEGAGGEAETDGKVRLPVAWTGVSVHAAGAALLRARLRPADGGGLSVVAADGAGGPVVSVDSLVTRPVPVGRPTAPGASRDGLLAVEWVPLVTPGESDHKPAGGRWAVIGADLAELTEELAAVGVRALAYPDLASLAGGDGPAPDVVLVRAGARAGDYAGDDAAASVAQALGLLQQWVNLERLAAARLVIITHGAVAAVTREGVADLAGAAVWGLVRAAQSENPGRLMLADLPAGDAVGMAAGDRAGVLAAAVECGEPEVAIRDRTVYGRRLARPDSGGLPVPDDPAPWRLEVTGRGTLEDIGLVGCPQADGQLAAGQVRVAVRAAGVNFRDVVIGLGIHPGDAELGSEIAGVVVETGPRVAGLAAGDRVLGLASGGFGPMAVIDARLLVPIPAGWSFAQAAAVPMAFATAWHALVDLAKARAGQRILVHAATGGVGMAAVTIARHLGLDVYATASPGKHHVLTRMGLDETHVASSRTEQFEQRFLAATEGQGMDIVLNSLAGKLTDAGLRLLRSAGTFIELGKSDLRDAAAIARDYPGVTYRAFDLTWASPDRLGQILTETTNLLANGTLAMPPVRAWDIRRADEALRFMSQARHAGKLVLVIPPGPATPRQPGTALVTGGTGMLGSLVAGHLAATNRARQLVLTSRSGPAATGAPKLAADLAGSGVGVRIAACDVADRDALAATLAGIPAAHPLTMVVHTAGVVDDGTIGTLTPEQVDAVMRPKASAAWHLHQLTQDADLEGFVLFSSTSAEMGGSGQGNYAAANALLDGLASHRRSHGLTATSIAWGMWGGDGGMAGRLGEGYRAKVARGGMAALTAEKGMALLDAALDRDDALLVAALLDVPGMRAQAAAGMEVPALWRGLAGGPARPMASVARSAESLRQRLEAMPQAGQAALVLELVVAQAAAVLGFGSPAQVQADREFRDLGFDSLTAIELRNGLASATGLRLPATLVFDYPTPGALARYLRSEIVQDDGGMALPVLAELDKLESLIAAVTAGQRAQVTARLETLLAKSKAAQHQAAGPELGEATAEELFELIDTEFGRG
ncbi:MAG: SDR family NAD(P)-dependent oxidoreductase, partial [Streptosporangiaceae bacterium]|nr:SDR family NAD(P)-dependent oxidoreductase [Streptosporangiaceae bacterium]